MLEMLTRPNDRPTESTTRIARQIVNLTFACALIALTLPLMAIVALAIKLDSPGPIFSHRECLGVGGRNTRVLIFRTVHARQHPPWRRDAHLTRVGWFLRYTHIDCLPQLVNVLRGEMTLLGTDRERPDFLR
jgi:lipopolysaccharide/colanic/teichoic acid biosynthesis glycosyltransferase